MDFLSKIESIKSKLIDLGSESIANEILELQISAGTGGEVLISVCSRLLEIERQNYELYKMFETEADELLEYARSLGLYPQ